MTTLREKALRHLVRHTEEVLAQQRENGEFWPDQGFHAAGATDYQQFAYYPLAWLYTYRHPDNPWHEDARLLAAVERSFRNCLEKLRANGDFWSSNHDGGSSTHPGNWRSFTWLRALELLRGKLAPRLEKESEDGLRRAFRAVLGQARRAVAEPGYGVNHNVRNHPAWYLTATLALARHFGDEDAAGFACAQLERVCACQHPAGVWFEHDGPVVVYHHVTQSALSHYHALTGSAAARAALERSLSFARLFTYPNGHPNEILDGRTRYTGYVLSIFPSAWALFPQGRAYLHFLLDRLLEQPLGAGYQVHGGWLGLPFFTQFARDLPEEEAHPASEAPLPGAGVHQPEGLPVRVIRAGPWTVSLSAFTRPEQPGNRWSLDYQTHLSVFHEKTGLIVGGGGGKRQAAWSLFTGGSRPLGLPCLATGGAVEIRGEAGARLRLDYPGFSAWLEAAAEPNRVRLTVRVERPPGPPDVAAPFWLQLPFPLKGTPPVVDGRGGRHAPELQAELTGESLGGSIGREGLFSISGLEGARAVLHLLPYNTHWKDGRAPAEKAMGVVAQPLLPGVERTLFVTA